MSGLVAPAIRRRMPRVNLRCRELKIHAKIWAPTAKEKRGVQRRWETMVEDLKQVAGHSGLAAAHAKWEEGKLELKELAGVQPQGANLTALIRSKGGQKAGKSKQQQKVAAGRRAEIRNGATPWEWNAQELQSLQRFIKMRV